MKFKNEPTDVPYQPSGDRDPYEAGPESAPELPDNIR